MSNTLSNPEHTTIKIPTFIQLKIANKKIVELENKISNLESKISILSSYTSEQLKTIKIKNICKDVIKQLEQARRKNNILKKDNLQLIIKLHAKTNQL
jgi:hypothetical protein